MEPKHGMTLAWPLAAFVLLCPNIAHAHVNPVALQGLNKVVLEVTSSGGVTAQGDLAGEVKTMLQQAGIQVVSKPEPPSPSTVPVLSLTMSLGCQREACAYRVWIELSEPVQLARSLRTRCGAITWRDGVGNGIATSDLVALPDIYAAEARALVMSFIDDVQRAQGRKPAARE